MLGVSRSSVREALALLVAAGKLRTWPGRGSFWVTVSAATPQSPDANTWYNEENGKEVDGPKIYLPSEIFQLRYQIEGQSCRLAAKRITEEEIEQLETNMRTFKSQTRAMDLEARAKTDFDFHQLIVEFSEFNFLSTCIWLFVACSYRPCRSTARNFVQRGSPLPSTRI